MITRDEIRAIPELHKSIMRDKEQLRFLHEKATSVPSGLSDRERVQNSPSNNANRYVEEAVDLNRDIQKKETRLLELQVMAKAFISTIEAPKPMNTPLYHKVMSYRYLSCMEWSKVAEMVGYTERRVQQIDYEIISRI